MLWIGILFAFLLIFWTGKQKRFVQQINLFLLCGLLSFSAVVGLSWGNGDRALAQSPSLVSLSRVSDLQPHEPTQTEITDRGGSHEAHPGEADPGKTNSGNRIVQTIAGLPTVSWEQIPPEAQTTINLIYQGGPFPYTRDGIEFQNRERLLPQQPRGYYREYTVETPGATNRGARRIVAGQNGEMYYTEDHYSSFVQVQY